MTCAPNVLQVIAVLHGTVEMGADRGKGLEIAGWRANENSRTAPEFENLRRVRLKFLRARRDDIVLLRFADCRRNEEFYDRINNRNDRRAQACG